MIERATVEAVLVGQPRPLARGHPSAIAKEPVAGRVAIGPEGLAGDAQADRRHHGGPDKAVHAYPSGHYPTWRAELGPAPPPALERPGGFGENLAVAGLAETDIRVGDVWRVGTALLQVSQGRQPCWKLDERFLPGMARRVQASGRTGWYFRVIEPGRVEAGDAMSLAEMRHPEWTIARIAQVFYHDRLNREALTAIAALPDLAPGWRQLASRRLASGAVEDWRRRLEGPG